MGHEPREVGMRRALLTGILKALTLVVLALPAQAQTLEERIASVLPTAKEDRWLKIPWKQNLLRGRIEAQRTKKPMLIWIMDGNVLGST